MNNLIQYWREYEAAMRAADYDADTVQGLGMRFCDEWKRLQDDIINKLCDEWHIKIEKKDFGYADHRWVMKRLDPSPESPCKLCKSEE